MPGRARSVAKRDRLCGPAAVVLAAGASSRFGGVKQLARIGGLTLVERAVVSIPRGRVREVVVVVGFEADSVAKSLGSRPDVKVVVNPDYLAGMSTSIRTGIRALSRDSTGALLILADQIFVTPLLLRRILEAFEELGRGRKIVAASEGGLVCPPVVFPKRYFAELESLQGDQGARSLIDRHPAELLTIGVRKRGTLRDVDTPEDLAEARRLLEP